MGLINERHFEIEGFKMIEYQRKRRFIAGLASLSFFIIASFCFGILVQNKSGEGVFGFHISDEGPFSWLNFFEAKAESDDPYPHGNVINNVLLVNLDGNDGNAPTWLDDAKTQTAYSILNGNGETLQSYIYEISYGKVNVNSILYRSSTNDGYIPSQTRDYYITGTNNETEADLEAQLLKEIVVQAQNDFSSKSTAELDTNMDGFLDNITFVIRGSKDVNHTLLWPHQFSLKEENGASLPEIFTSDGSTLKVKDYNVILSGESSNQITTAGIFNAENSDLGVIAHEYLHVYGFPDMYHNYKYDEVNKDYIPLPQSEQIGDPLGQWDVMDNTNPKLPQYPLVYTNLAYSPWSELVPQLTTIDASTQNVNLDKVTYGDAGKRIAAIIKVDPTINAKGESEYFMVEYRKQEGWDASLPNQGLLIYRINTLANTRGGEVIEYCKTNNDGTKNHCGNMFGAPDEVFILRPNPESVETGNATGNTDTNLEQAAFSSGSFGKTLEEVSDFQQSTFGETIYFSDGSNSGIVLSNININGDVASFDISVPESKEDHDAPVIHEATGNGINGNWTHSSPIISVHVSDTGHGLQEIKVTTQGGEIVGGSDASTYAKNYTAADQVKNTNFEFTVKKNGTYKVTAKDFNDNVTEKEIKVEYIDTIQPVIDAGTISASATQYTLPVTFTDNESGIDTSSAFYTTVGIKEDTNNLQYNQPIHGGTIQLPVDFQGKVCITVKDIAGNEAKNPSCWVVSNDRNAPVIETNADIREDTWTAEALRITITAKDIVADDTGISYFEITTEDGKLDASNAHHIVKDLSEQGGAQESFAFNVLSNGTYKIKVCDYANKCAEDEVKVKNIDLSAPVISAINVENVKKSGLFSTSAHNIQFVAHDEPVDANSGLREIRYQLVEEAGTVDNDISSTAWKKAAVDEILFTDEGVTGTIYAYAVDNVGNVSRIFEKKIERVSNSLVNDAFQSGIQDADKKVNIIGLQDPDVTMELKDVDLEVIKSKLGEDYLSSYVLQNVYDISLLKSGNPYALSEEITVRFAIDEALQSDGTLKVIALDADGNVSEVDSSLGDGYIEFKTTSLSLFATVTSAKDATVQPKDTSVVSEAGPQTGDESTIALYIVGMISTILAISFLTYRHRLD